MKNKEIIRKKTRTNNNNKSAHYSYLSACVKLLINDEVDYVSLKNIEQRAVEEYISTGIFRKQIIWDREGSQFLKRVN